MAADREQAMDLLLELTTPAPGDTPEAQADAWAAYLYSGAATEAGRAAFSRWLDETPANARAYRRAEQILRDLDLPGAEGFFQPVPLVETAEEDSAPGVIPFDRARRRGAPSGVPVSRRRVLAAGFGIAASLLVAVSVWRVALYDPVTTVNYASRTGEVRTVTLEDGSRITLRPDSALTARLSRKARQVELASGGAYFAVAPDAERPFTVAAYATEVRVVGTRFDVARRPDGVRVAVAEGVVDVAPAAPPREAPGAPAAGARLTAGQQVFARTDGALGPVRPFDAVTGLAWREGRLVFRDARLADVVAEINGYRRDKVAVADLAASDLRVTATVPAGETDKLLAALEATRPVTVERTDGRVILRSKR